MEEDAAVSEWRKSEPLIQGHCRCVVVAHFHLHGFAFAPPAILHQCGKQGRGNAGPAMCGLYEKILDVRSEGTIIHRVALGQDHITGCFIVDRRQPDATDLGIIQEALEGLGSRLAIQGVSGFRVKLGHQADKRADVLRGSASGQTFDLSPQLAHLGVATPTQVLQRGQRRKKDV